MKEIEKFDRERAEKVPCFRYIYKTTEGEPLELSISYPKEKNPKACLFFIHGGGWRGDSLERLKPHAQYAALNGAVGVSISYRMLNGEKATDVRDGLKDCIDALEFVRGLCRERYGELTVVAAGDSAGGYYAACLGCRKILDRLAPEVKRADYVVDFNGIVDLTGKWEYGIFRKKSDAQPREEIEKAYSPLYNVGKADAPVLILHGDRDKTVALSDSEAYCRALEKAGVTCGLHRLEGAAHAFILFDYRHDNAYVAEILTWTMAFLRENGLI